MRARIAALTVGAALVVGGGVGYVVAGAGSAAAQSPAAKSPSTDERMMRWGGSMMGAEHAKMMRDGKMRRQHERAMRDFPEMARMMREHMEG